MRRRRSYQTELPAPVSFEPKTIFNIIEGCLTDEKFSALFVGALGCGVGYAELLFSSFPCFVFVLLFALLAVLDEDAVVAGAVLFPFFYFFGFLSQVFEGVTFYLHPESAIVAYKKSVSAPC